MRVRDALLDCMTVEELRKAMHGGSMFEGGIEENEAKLTAIFKEVPDEVWSKGRIITCLGLVDKEQSWKLSGRRSSKERKAWAKKQATILHEMWSTVRGCWRKPTKKMEDDPPLCRLVAMQHKKDSASCSGSSSSASSSGSSSSSVSDKSENVRLGAMEGMPDSTPGSCTSTPKGAKRALPMPSGGPAAKRALPMPGETPAAKRALPLPSDMAGSSKDAPRGFSSPPPPGDMQQTIKDAEEAPIVNPGDQVQKKPASRLKKPAAADADATWIHMNLPKGFPDEILPQGPHGQKSYTVTSPKGAKVEVLATKNAFFVKNSLKEDFGNSCHISWSEKGPQHTWDKLKKRIGW